MTNQSHSMDMEAASRRRVVTFEGLMPMATPTKSSIWNHGNRDMIADAVDPLARDNAL
ncbi:hypothetical protein [Azospirillum endophyticum]